MIIQHSAQRAGALVRRVWVSSPNPNVTQPADLDTWAFSFGRSILYSATQCLPVVTQSPTSPDSPSGHRGESLVMAGLSQRAMASARPLRRLPSPVTRSRNPRETPRRSAMHLARAAAVERPPRPISLLYTDRRDRRGRECTVGIRVGATVGKGGEPPPLRAADGTLIVTARFVQGRRG